MQNIFVTGGNTLIPNFDVRLHNALRPNLPVSTPVTIVRGYDNNLDAWCGMAKWSRTPEMQKTNITRAEYQEFGADYYKAHGLGNAA